ncbi:MAG: rhodanese-like domain-containing protein [Clostridia bacterium]|nr:rhodanese-like domain-containing protein [Clostridia bacterium]
MKRVLFCCALAGALAITAIVLASCKQSADNGSISTSAPKSETDAPASTTSSVPAKGSYKTISQAEAKAEMDALTAQGTPFILLDVRRADEFATAHIEGALLLPNEEIGTERPQELPDLSVPIYVYCRSGRRSLEAAKKLAAMGYTVYDFGGIIDWQYGTVNGGST